MPLGILANGEFEADIKCNSLGYGDTLIIVSDGVLELKNEQGIMLGQENVKTLILSAYKNTNLVAAQAFAERQLADYRGQSEQLDDITLVALRHFPEAK